MREVLDTALNKVMSRKLMVWGTATIFMFMDTVPLASEDWVAISLAYIGIEGLADIASRWRHGR
jgi:succinate-acetate transporter protein